MMDFKNLKPDSFTRMKQKSINLTVIETYAVSRIRCVSERGKLSNICLAAHVNQVDRQGDATLSLTKRN